MIFWVIDSLKDQLQLKRIENVGWIYSYYVGHAQVMLQCPTVPGVSAQVNIIYWSSPNNCDEGHLNGCHCPSFTNYYNFNI